jgi:hypothetical protein
MVKTSAGKQFRKSFEMSLLNDDRVTLRTDPVIRLGVALTWQF